MGDQFRLKYRALVLGAVGALGIAGALPQRALAQNKASCSLEYISHETAINVMAATTVDEDRATGPDGYLAIATTMMLRAEGLIMKRKELSIEQAVVASALAERQYSGWNKGTASKPSVSRARLILASSGSPTDNAEFDGKMAGARAVAEAVFAGKRAPGALASATHFYNPKLASPTWATSGQIVGKVGDHVFLANVPGPAYPRCLVLSWNEPTA